MGVLEFLIAEDGNPELDQVLARIRGPSRADIESAFRTADEVWYGTHYLLRGDDVDIVAISTQGPFTRQHEQGQFLLYRRGILVKERGTRDDAIQLFLCALE